MFAYEDTCLVYLVTDGDRALLVDCGSGDILNEIAGLGLCRIDWVLHTHHHRDQCQGDERLIGQGARLAAPERETHLIAAPERLWDERQVPHRYDLGTDLFTPRAGFPVTATLTDYSTFRWGQHAFRVLPAPGHTKGSVVLLLEVDGKRMAFTGDLIASPGAVWSLDALQWSYGGGVGILDGVQPAVHSLSDLQAERLDLLLPSHGQIMDNPGDAIGDLITNLRALVRFQEADANEIGMGGKPVGLVIDRKLVQLTDHLWMNQYAFANSYVLVSDRGNALFMDYGYPTFHHFMAGFRFAEHSIRELGARAGLRKIDLVIPSHYHDDHVGGVPYLQQRYGARVWAHEVMVPILERPGDYCLPCLMAEPIRVERSLCDGETFEWEGITFTILHTPGHTHYHATLCFELDGVRAALTGDALHGSSTGPILGGPIYGNRFALGDFQRSVERLRAWGPDILLTGHTGVVEIDAEWLDIARRRAQEGDARVRALAVRPEGAGFALDPSWVSVHPYQQMASAGERRELEVRVRNHGQDASAVLRPEAPDGWSVEPGEATGHIPAGEEGQFTFTVQAPADWDGAHTTVICIDVSWQQGSHRRRLGQIVEGLIRFRVRPGTSESAVEEAEKLVGASYWGRDDTY